MESSEINLGDLGEIRDSNNLLVDISAIERPSESEKKSIPRRIIPSVSQLCHPGRLGWEVNVDDRVAETTRHRRVFSLVKRTSQQR